MFADLQARFKNVVTGVLTRNSLRRAFKLGITAQQIIHFLRVHAHPQMITAAGSGGHVIPLTLVDQIRLWELERERMKYQPGIMYSSFVSVLQWKNAKAFAETNDALLWSSPEPLIDDAIGLILIIDPGIHEGMKANMSSFL